MKCKLLHLFALAFTSIIFAQTKNEEAALSFFWGENDSYKNSVDIPDKWKNESAVIIYKNENYDFHKFGKNVTYKTSVRKRIKLLDKAAVEEFSEFSYQKRFRSAKGYSKANQSKNIIGVKIIKPNGDETIIDIHKDAVVVDGETKVAIANLEVGDIIDYYSYSIEPFKTTYAFGFDPVEKSLGEEYPIMDYKLFFETENDFFINFNSYNGAPDLKELPTDKKSIRRYELVAQDIDKHKYERWFYPLVELPAYKFQVYFARSGKFEKKAIAFLPEKEKIIKKTVSSEEVLEFYDYVYPYGNLRYEERFIKDHDFSNDAEKVTEVFYFMRHYYLTRFVEAIIIKDAGIIDYPYSVYGDDSRFFNDDLYFIRHFIAVLKENKIKYDIILSKKRYDGPLDDLLIKKNLEMVIKAKTEPPVYIQYFGPHTTINTFPTLLEGADSYVLPVNKKWHFSDIKRGTIPLSSYQTNETKKEISLSFTDDFTGFTVSSEISYRGHEKEDEQYDRLIFKDYIDEDYKKFETKPYIDRLKKKRQDKIRQELNAVIEKLRENQKESFIKSAKGDYGIDNIDDYSYTINETGRYAFEDPMSFSEQFTTKGSLIKKAGPNYIVELGKLIGGQIEITDEERDRVENIYMEYPRSYNYLITLDIPEGYSVSGLDKLNKSVDNKTGAFISTAKVEGDKLIITTSKQYKHNYIENSDWNLITDFLDEAYQFTHEKILLKKN